MPAPDGPVYSALERFADNFLDGSWNGQREHEAVSAFAFGPLLQEIDSNGLLNDSLQIGMEFTVPQVTRPGESSDGKKNQVFKDLVIWDEPRMTCWDSQDNPTIFPAAIIEWKYLKNSISEYDVDWLKAFTTEYPDCIGYAVTANQPKAEFRLSCTRISNGQEQPEWLHIS